MARQVSGRGSGVLSVRALPRLRGTASWTIVSNAVSMIGAMVVTSGFGVAYWLLAAHLFPRAAVGFAGASISAMALLGNVGMLGLGTLLIGELPHQPGQEKALVVTALVVAGTVGVVLGLVFALAAPLASPALRPLAGDSAAVALFALGVALTSITAVLDQALIGLLRGGLQFGRNAVFAALKLGALVAAGLWLGRGDWLAIYATWVFGNLTSLAGLGLLLALKGGRVHPRRLGLQRYLLRRFGGRALGHHWLNLALQLPGFALPVVVTVILSPTANAYFYVASMVSGLVFFGPMALVTALYAVGTRSPAALTHRMRFTLGLAMGAGVLVNIVLFVGADRVLEIFGSAYAAQAGWTLRVLGLGVFPVIVKDHYVTINRVQGRVMGAALLATVGGVLELAMAAIGGLESGSLLGVALGWLGALYLEALVMAPIVYRVAARTDESEAEQAEGAYALIGRTPRDGDGRQDDR